MYPYKIWLAEVRKYFVMPVNPRVSKSDVRRIEEYERATGRKFPGALCDVK
jgi:hypothetical protein